MVKTTTKIDKKLQNDLSRKYLIFAVTCIVVGLIGVLFYALRDLIFNTNSNWSNLFLVFFIPLGIGMLMVFLVIKTKRTTIVEERVVDYVFSDKNIEVFTHKSSGDINTKIDYNNILKIKNTKHFIFIYLNGEVVYPIDVRGLSADELTELKSYLNINNEKE